MSAGLLDALNALYSHPDPKVKEEASRWLEAWQHGTEAWQVSDAVLHGSGADAQTQLFCAQTLKSKVQQDFEELPQGAHASLRDSLVVLLIKFASSPATVRTQLCLALAAFAAHVPRAHWGAGGPVQWFAGRLGGEPQEVAVPCMLELMVVMPQEGESSRVCVGPARRRQFVSELQSCLPDVLQVLNSCMGYQHTKMKALVLEALGAWLRLCSESDAVKSLQLQQHPLVPMALRELAKTDNFHQAADVVVELLWLTTNSTQYRPEPQMMSLVQLLVPAVFALRPRFCTGLKRAQAEAKDKDPLAVDPGKWVDDDDEVVKGLARVFCEMGEAYIGLIAEASPDVKGFVEALLEVASHPQESVFGMTFDFWHRLSHRVLSSFSEDSNITSGVKERQSAMFGPMYERLMSLMQAQVRYPNNFHELRSDEAADLNAVRANCTDPIRDAAAVMGATPTLSRLVTSLKALVDAPRVAGKSFDWQSAEALLFCTRNVASTCRSAEDALLQQLFGILTTLPEEPQLQYTVSLCVSSYAAWLAKRLKMGHKAVLPPVLRLLRRNLSNYRCSNAAARGLMELCDYCGEFMGDYMDSLLELYLQVIQAANGHLGWTPQQPDGLKVSEDDVHTVVHGICLVASRSGPEAQRQRALAALAEPPLAALEAVLQGASPPQKGSAGQQADLDKQQIVVLVDRLTLVFKHMECPPGIAAIVGRSWLLLDHALEAASGDWRTTEHVCRCLRHGLKSAARSSAPLLLKLAPVLPSRFAASLHPAFLYVASELAKIFGSDPSQASLLRSMLTDLLTRACGRLRRLADFDEIPDVADDTFLLALRVLQYCPDVLLGCVGTVEVLLDTACAGVLVQHREACCSILNFLGRLIDPPGKARASPGDVTQAFEMRAPYLMRLLVGGIAGALPSSRLEDVSETLHKVLSETRERGVHWLRDAVAMLPDSSASAQEKEQFMAAVVRSGSVDSGRLRDLEDAVYDLSECCRRNKSARVAAQQAVLPADLHVAVH